MLRRRVNDVEMAAEEMDENKLVSVHVDMTPPPPPRLVLPPPSEHLQTILEKNGDDVEQADLEVLTGTTLDSPITDREK